MSASAQKMKLPLRLFLSVLLAFAFAFTFNFFFLNLPERSHTDQILLVALSTAALGYLIFSIWGTVMKTNGLHALPINTIRVNRMLFTAFFREHAYGILLALLFFAVYTYIALQINRPGVDTVDNYLDADNSSWMQRISAPNGYTLEMRGPHPFAYFIFRPLGWFLNLFTQNPPLTAILLNTFAGALCVFMAWIFIKRQFQDSAYALLVASLLGLSGSHLFFGSVIETYIFSAAALIGFILVIQKRTHSLLAPVILSLITFGITLTNFVQNLIAFLVAQTPMISHPEHQPGAAQKTFTTSLFKIFRFTAFTISLGILISIIHTAWYPSSKLFFLLSDAQAEDEFAFSIFQEPAWKAIGRVTLLIRTILLYTVILPKPHVFTEEVGGTFPRFNFFKISPGTFAYSNYDGLGNLLVIAWGILLFAAGSLFLWNLIRARKVDLTLAFVLSLLFNFVLHLNYGYEPFLYSPDWAYALIFFVALSLGPLVKNRLFQGGMLIFLILLAYNQFQFFQFIFVTTAPFIGQGN